MLMTIETIDPNEEFTQEEMQRIASATRAAFNKAVKKEKVNRFEAELNELIKKARAEGVSYVNGYFYAH